MVKEVNPVLKTLNPIIQATTSLHLILRMKKRKEMLKITKKVQNLKIQAKNLLHLHLTQTNKKSELIKKVINFRVPILQAVSPHPILQAMNPPPILMNK